jgi:hypothetical protein
MTVSDLFQKARKLPVLRSSSRTSPPYHVGSVIENRLGFQVYRVLGKALARQFRRRYEPANTNEFSNILHRDGLLVIERFLDQDSFAAVANEFENANSASQLRPYKDAAGAKLYRRQLRLAEISDQLPVTKSLFRDNKFLDDIVSAAIRRPIEKRPEVLLDTYQRVNQDGEDNDIENILHADLHVPTIKMFFYLDKADSCNGAFIYAKGSHRLTFPRIAHEYELSIREAKSSCGRSVPERMQERRANQVRNIIGDDARRRMRIKETQVCAEANTLVIANNMGFHRRGEFASDRPRKALLINYRNAEPLFW